MNSKQQWNKYFNLYKVIKKKGMLRKCTNIVEKSFQLANVLLAML